MVPVRNRQPACVGQGSDSKQTSTEDRCTGKDTLRLRVLVRVPQRFTRTLQGFIGVYQGVHGAGTWRLRRDRGCGGMQMYTRRVSEQLDKRLRGLRRQSPGLYKA